MRVAKSGINKKLIADIHRSNSLAHLKCFKHINLWSFQSVVFLLQKASLMKIKCLYVNHENMTSV